MSSSSVGIDVGASGVRIAETTTKGGNVTLRRYAEQPLPFGAVKAGTVLEPRVVTMVLRALWKEHRFGTKRVSIGTTSGKLAVRQITLPELPPKELRASLPFLVGDVVPLPPDKAVMDFLQTGEGSRAKTVDGLVVAIPKDGVLSLVSAVQEAGLDVIGVDLDAFALLRLLAGQTDPERAEALIEFGASTTTVVVHRGGTPLLVRVITRGSEDVTQGISQRLGISRAEADEAKHMLALGLQEEAAVREAAMDGLRPILGDVRSSLAYFRSGNPDQPLTCIQVAGGGAHLEGLVDALSAQQEVPVMLADPYRSLIQEAGTTEPGVTSTTGAIAVGLTIGGTNVHA